ncbi:MAG: tRNA (adenosine(37)-N6)-dimethylallyltransferase MiaA [Xanthobacteraceae bacterium]|nr:tRNA (adenosine(37)-N6)-dimethylallyltransferase MiaA [Xanthobacteraceae bacterium]
MDAILLAGPTTSGKSALALALAEELGGTIINADSMQVYRDLRIITARPSPADEARVPHLLYGHVDAAENYSVGRWCVDAPAAIAQARQAGRMPIVVGGTGLYFKTLTQGLAAVPPIPAGTRAAVRERLAADGVAPLYAELQQRDPVTAERLMPGDRSRITRALEVVLTTGRSLTDWHREGMPAVIDATRTVKLFLDVERAELYRRIDARFDAMLVAGALDEVSKLAQRGLDASLPAMKAHGVPWLIRHLKGDITLAEAADRGKRDTCRYTKRQTTWFRNQLPGFAWTKPGDALAFVSDAIRR